MVILDLDGDIRIVGIGVPIHITAEATMVAIMEVVVIIPVLETEEYDQPELERTMFDEPPGHRLAHRQPEHEAV